MRLHVATGAKINLTLDVVARRDDGYHELRSLVQSIDFWDEMTIATAPGFRLSCNRSELANDENLVARAARQLAALGDVEPAAAIHLSKQIPVGAGLGGGSGNAAGALLGLKRLWDMEVSDKRLRKLAALLGADVPYFLHGGCAVMEGIGERVTPLPAVAPGCAVVVYPPVSLSTADIYRRFDYGRIPSSDRTAAAAAAAESNDVDGLASVVGNDLQPVVCEVAPELERARRTLLASGARAAAVTGSGAALFGLCANVETAGDVATEFLARWRRSDWSVRTAKFSASAVEVRQSLLEPSL